MEMGAVRQRLLDAAEITDWVEFVDLWKEATSRQRPDWTLPFIGGAAISKQAIDETGIAAAVGALQLSIILVDNILDDDDGPHTVWGAGKVSNLALAFQAAAFACAMTVSDNFGIVEAILSQMETAALGTAYGQHCDVITPLSDEAEYWRVVRAKSTPFYGATLALGAAAAGGSAEQVDLLHRLGLLIGEAVQVTDDLVDALAVEPSPDWMKRRQNLAILFATCKKRANPLQSL